MSRDPYAKALRVKPQQVIPDKREALRRKVSDTFHQLHDDILDEEIPDSFKRLLDDLD